MSAAASRPPFRRAVAVPALLLAVGILVALLWPRGGARAPANETLTTPDVEARPDAAAPALAAAGTTIPAPVNLGLIDPRRDAYGTVVDPDGGPVAGARVDATRDSSPWTAAGTLVGSATSARDGSFAIRLPTSAPVVLTVTARGFAPAQRAKARPGEPQHIVLSRGVTWSITVVDPAGDPVAGAAVAVHIAEVRGSFAPLTAETNAQGRVEFTGLPPRTPVWAIVRHPNFAQPSPTPCEKMPMTGTIESRIAVDAGQVLEGRCLDATTGAPIAGARVGLDQLGTSATFSDADGHFQVLHVPRNDMVSLWFEADGYGSRWTTHELPGPIAIRIGRTFVVRGRVVTQSGRPVRDASVDVTGFGGEWIQERSVTSPEGAFRIEGARTGLDLMVVARPPNGPAVGRLVNATSEYSPEVDAGDLVVPLGERIAGRVVHADGLPAEGVDVERLGTPLPGDPPRSVRILAAALAKGSTTTDGDGRFAFEDAVPGEYVVTARVPGGVTRETRVSIEAGLPVGELLLTLPTLRRVDVSVLDDVGEPVTSARVVRRGSVWDGFPVVFDEEGRGTAWVDSDTVGLAVTCYGAGPGERRVLLTGSRLWPLPPPGATLRIVIPRATRVRGRVLGPEGKPIPRAVVHIGGDDSSYSCGADGTFSMTVENTGSVTLRYEGEAYVGDEAEPRADDLFAEATSEAHEGEEIVLRASRPEGGRLQSVLVLDPDGQPVEGAQVSHAIGFEWEEAGTTDPLGLVTVTGLRARAYRWAAAAPVNAVPSRSEMTVTSPGPSLIVLRLERPRLLRGRVQIPEGIDAKDVRIVLQVVTATRDSKHFQRPDPDGGTFAIDVTGSERRAGELGAVCVVYAEVGPQERPTHRGPRAPVDVRNPTDVVLTLDPVR